MSRSTIFGDNLISRIVFKTCDLGRSKVHIAVVPHPSSYPMRSLGNPKRGPIALRAQPHSLDHLRLRNSEPFSPANKLTSNRSDVALPACRTNANASWDPWRKLVAPLKQPKVLAVSASCPRDQRRPRENVGAGGRHPATGSSVREDASRPELPQPPR